MTSEEFANLYNKQVGDDSLTSFTNDVGFSLIRNYPAGTPYAKDGKKIFIKIAILRGKLFYSVDMVKPEKIGGGEEVSYVIKEGDEYKKKTTNFFSDDQGEFSFDESSKKIVFQPKNKSFSMNEFVDILVLNHLSDRLFFKRVWNWIAEAFLRVVFWLCDKHYDKIKVSLDKYHIGRDNQPVKEDEKNVEPFFKYFYISKNTIFALLLLTFVLVIASLVLPGCVRNLWPFGEFSLSNPFVILFFFLILFSCEKFSIWLNKKIKEFFEKESAFHKKVNFIENLHNYQYQNRFKLKLK